MQEEGKSKFLSSFEPENPKANQQESQEENFSSQKFSKRKLLALGGEFFYYGKVRQSKCSDVVLEAAKRTDKALFKSKEDAQKCAPENTIARFGPCEYNRGSFSCGITVGGNKDNDDINCFSKITDAAKTGFFSWSPPVFKNLEDLQKCGPTKGQATIVGGTAKLKEGTITVSNDRPEIRSGR